MKKHLRLLAVVGLVGSLALSACGAVGSRDENTPAALPPTSGTPLAPNTGNETTDNLFDQNERINVAGEFMSASGTVISIDPVYDWSEGESTVSEDRFFVLIETDNSSVNFIVSGNTVNLVENLEVGMEVIGFYDANLPMIMIYPMQAEAVVLAEVGGNAGSVFVDRFDENLLSSDGSAVVNVTDETVIVLQDGTPFEGGREMLAGCRFAVVYSVSTRSMPPQLQAEKIIVLFERAVHPILTLTPEEMEGIDFGYVGIAPPIGLLTPEDIHTMWANSLGYQEVVVTINGEAVQLPTIYFNENGFVMVPVAAIAEKLGYNIVGEGADVVVGMGMTFTVGEDSYFVGRMAPRALGAAPELKDGTLFVPLNFFTEMIQAHVFVESGNITIDNAPQAE